MNSVCLLSLLLQAPVVPAPSIGGPVQPISPSVRCGPRPLVAPEYQGKIDLSAYVDCNATFSGQSGPWSAKLSPDGSMLIVTLSGLAGTFGVQNCKLVAIDTATDAVIGVTTVELFPEELAWTTSGAQIATGYVTNSSSGTLSVFDANGTVLQNIVLPDPLNFGSCFPFGIALSPAQDRAYVGTVDGSGAIYAIDTSAQTVETSETLAIPGTHGRLATYGRLLIVPVTEYDAFFTSSTASLVFVDPADVFTAVTLPIPSAATFPSAQDVAVRCDGRVFVAGIDLGASVHVFDARTSTYLHAIPSVTGAGVNQGLALSSDGLLAVADYITEQIAFIDSWTEQDLATADLDDLIDVHADPEELVFSKDGRKLWAVCNASASIAVFEVP